MRISMIVTRRPEEFTATRCDKSGKLPDGQTFEAGDYILTDALLRLTICKGEVFERAFEPAWRFVEAASQPCTSVQMTALQNRQDGNIFRTGEAVFTLRIPSSDTMGRKYIRLKDIRITCEDPSVAYVSQVVIDGEVIPSLAASSKPVSYFSSNNPILLLHKEMGKVVTVTIQNMGSKENWVMCEGSVFERLD